MLIVVAFPAKEDIQSRIDRVLIELFIKDLGYTITNIYTDELEKVVEFKKKTTNEPMDIYSSHNKSIF